MGIGDVEGQGAGTGGAGGAPAEGTGGSGGTSGESTPSPIALSDDSLVQIPGESDPISWKDYAARQTQAQTDWETRRKAATQLLEQRARDLDARAQQFQQRQGQPQGQQPGQSPADPLAAVRSKPVVDGQTIVSLIEQLQAQGRPVQDWAKAINQILTSQHQQLHDLTGRLQPFEAQQQESARTESISSALDAAGVQLSNPALAEASDVLRDFGANVYYGWHPSRSDFDSDQAFSSAVQQFSQEYPGLVAKQVEGLRSAFRTLDRLEAAEARKRLIPGQGGSASPNGDRPYQFETPRQLARRAREMGIFDTAPTT